MCIPTYEERIANKFGEVLEDIKTNINHAILNGQAHSHNSGYTYFRSRVASEWPDEELRSWLEKEYREAGWGLDFVWADPDNESGDCLVEIYKYKGA